jgi:hypothetical protein
MRGQIGHQEKKSDDEIALKENSAHINIQPTYHHPIGIL